MFICCVRTCTLTSQRDIMSTFYSSSLLQLPDYPSLSLPKNPQGYFLLVALFSSAGRQLQIQFVGFELHFGFLQYLSCYAYVLRLNANKSLQQYLMLIYNFSSSKHFKISQRFYKIWEREEKIWAKPLFSIGLIINHSQSLSASCYSRNVVFRLKSEVLNNAELPVTHFP